MFAFTIAISPNEEGFGVFCLIFDVLGYNLLILQGLFSILMMQTNLSMPYIRNYSECGCIKEAFRRRKLPILEVRGKFHCRKVPRYTGHRDIAVSPWRSKVIVEGIVLNEIQASIVLLLC